MTLKRMKFVDLYIRVSTDEQADKGFSLRHQEEALRKYCTHHNLHICRVIIEDFSAKTFNRPEWNKYMADIKKRKNLSDAVLFLKWDRFSRNIAEAYQMIATLNKLGIEPQAIEQPLDMAIPENKIILAVYLAAPEVENDRRALNVLNGMRRALKEGRCMGLAPIGYCNKSHENGRKYICPKYPEADLVKWAFETIATGSQAIEQVLKQARAKGLRCSKNNFWWMLRNPIYYGKIIVPQYKDEPMILVQGQHEAIISEQLFFDVQDILNGKKKKMRLKQTADSMLPLRGFLACPSCGKTLTGSASKGRNAYYHYYHCTSECGVRTKAQDINDAFVSEIKRYTPHPLVVELFKEVVQDVYQSDTSSRTTEKKQLLQEIETQNKRLTKARSLLLDDAIDATDYKTIKQECETKIQTLEGRLGSFSAPKEDISGILEKACYTLSNLHTLYEESTVEVQRQLIGSMFPEKIVFERNRPRTTRVNEALRVLYSIDKAFSQNKKGQTNNFVSLSQEVIPLGLEPRAHTLKVYCSTN